MTSQEDNCKIVCNILRKLKLDNAQDLKVLMAPRLKYAMTTTIIRINPNLNPKTFKEVFCHELLHYFGLQHNETTRRLGFISSGIKTDILARAFMETLA